MAGKQGFASMEPERVREIAGKGGRAAHAKGTGHEWTTETARQAGQKGGAAVSRDRAHMSAIGRRGGAVRARVCEKKRMDAARTFMQSRTPAAVA